MPPTVPRESFGADLGDAMCACDVLIGQARTYLRPCDSELRFGVVEVGAAARSSLPCGLPWRRQDHVHCAVSCGAPLAFLILPMDMPRQITTKSSSQR